MDKKLEEEVVAGVRSEGDLVKPSIQLECVVVGLGAGVMDERTGGHS